MYFTLLIHISNSISIKYYLLYDLLAYILNIILNYKNLQFKQLIDVISINFQSRNFARMEYIKRGCNSMMDLAKCISNKNILSKVVT